MKVGASYNKKDIYIKSTNNNGKKNYTRTKINVILNGLR